ncbi:NAD(P)/FAD-dependent oxidoreductase [Streptomyces sp. NPDC050658]|uniref:NAD(P)/FAD-dependent oxidoreductase n=1 Tax=unclassified Streptomyces TaxID=2593676 RepID=UPI0034367A63
MRTEVVVIGAGVVGLSLALGLRLAGRQVTVLEGEACGAGASGRAQGQLVMPFDERVRPLFDSSVEEYRMLHAGAGRADDFEAGQIGHLVLTRDPEADLSASHPDAAQLLDQETVRTLEPEVTSSVMSAAWYPRAWRVNPRVVTALYANACRAAGVNLLEQHYVAALDRRGYVWRILTSRGQTEAPTVVIAAGAGSADLAAQAGVRLLLHGVGGTVLRTVPTMLTLRHILSEATSGTDATWTTPSVSPGIPPRVDHVRFMAHTTGTGQIVLGSSWSPPDIREPAPIRPMLEHAVRMVPAMGGIPIAARSHGFRPCTPDGLPYIGQIAEGLFTCCGHGGAGFIAGPGSTILLVQLMLGIPTFIDPTPFDPHR